MPTVLFLCSGNYYRSRFAEAMFNSLAAAEGHAWRAESRGFRLHPGNKGPISVHALEGLRARSIHLAEPLRDPLVATENDFQHAALVVALKEAEHRSMAQSRFPDWAERIEYWNIHDIDCSEPDASLRELESQVRALMARLCKER